MSIVCPDFFATVDLHLGKAKALYINLSAILVELPVIIILGDFFQFSLRIKRSLWKVPLSLHEEYG